MRIEDLRIGDVFVSGNSGSQQWKLVRIEGTRLYVNRVDNDGNINTMEQHGSFSSDIRVIKKAHNNMTLIEKAKLAFKGEPEKSFIKAGVMDSNENLTDDGQALFMTFLLKKHGEDFKTTVIDPILKEVEATKE